MISLQYLFNNLSISPNLIFNLLFFPNSFLNLIFELIHLKTKNLSSEELFIEKYINKIYEIKKIKQINLEEIKKLE